MSRSPDRPQPSQPGSGPVAVHAVVRGRVQGVGFRYFVAREARRLGVAGWVRNADEGEVEAYATGDRATLNNFIEALERGPMMARVDGVETNWNVPVEPGHEFIIRP